MKFLNHIFRISGVTSEKRTTPIVVSLTSIPERYPYLHQCVEALLNQSLKPDYLVLWLSEKEVPHSRALPPRLEYLQKRGLTIHLVRDVGPYTKLLYALKRFRSSIIVTADDDTLYPGSWLEKLYTAHLRLSSNIICYRGTKISFDQNGGLHKYLDWPEFDGTGPSWDLFPTGKDGILYPPNSLHEEVFHEQVFQSICPTADDIWFKAMSLMQKTPCCKLTPLHHDFPTIEGTQVRTLHSINNHGGQNDVQIRKVFDKYGIEGALRSS